MPFVLSWCDIVTPWNQHFSSRGELEYQATWRVRQSPESPRTNHSVELQDYTNLGCKKPWNRPALWYSMHLQVGVGRTRLPQVRDDRTRMRIGT